MGFLATADSKFGSLPTFIDAADDVQSMEIIVEDGTVRHPPAGLERSVGQVGTRPAVK